MTLASNHDSCAGVEVKEEREEEDTLGQLRDRQVLAFARAAVPGPRAPFVHIKVEDSTSGEDTDDEGGGGVEEEATGGEGAGEAEREQGWEEAKKEEEPSNLRAYESGASLGGRIEAVHPQSLPPGAHSEPGSPRAQLRAPGRVADNAVQDNDVQHPDEEGEAGCAPVPTKRRGGGHAGTSQCKGVYWDKTKHTWKAKCKKKYLGLHTTEEGAARAYRNYLKNGIVPDPAERGRWVTSQFKGVSWDKQHMQWKAQYKGTHLGHHATEVEAVRAYNKYLEDGIDPVKHRNASTSQFTGVNWDKNAGKWRVTCKGTYLGLHTSEKSAARSYNVEAKRVGRRLNVIPPAGAAGVGASAGPSAGGGASAERTAPKTPAAPSTNETTKRAAPTTLAASAPSRTTKLQGTSQGAAGPNGIPAVSGRMAGMLGSRRSHAI